MTTTTPPDAPPPATRTLNHFALIRFSILYHDLDPHTRKDVNTRFLTGLRAAAPSVELYQTFGVEPTSDILVWSACPVTDKSTATTFFAQFARALNPLRVYLDLTTTLWGYTHPAQPTQTPATHALDPFTGPRQQYLALYPFSQTADWYQLSREMREAMLSEHILIGEQHADIRQLPLYSLGLQDQEFIVVYELDDLLRFYDLVNELRSARARAYTLPNIPVHTALYHPAEETLALWA